MGYCKDYLESFSLESDLFEYSSTSKRFNLVSNSSVDCSSVMDLILLL